jgi:hypothetical protein
VYIKDKILTTMSDMKIDDIKERNQIVMIGLNGFGIQMNDYQALEAWMFSCS